MNDPNAVGFITEEEKKEVAELEKMGAAAAEGQKDQLEAARDVVAEWNSFEFDRKAISQQIEQHQRVVYDEVEPLLTLGMQARGAMTPPELERAADRLEQILKMKRELESQHPDLKHRRYLMTAPDLIEAGIAKPAPNSAEASLDDDSATYLKARYDYDSDAAEKDEPSRPKSVAVGREGVELNPMALDTRYVAQPNRTEEELQANEEAARQVVEAQKPRVVVAYRGLEAGIRPEIVEAAARHVSLDEMESLDGSGALRSLTPIALARRTMREAFDADPDFFETYVANVAMLLHDRHGITEYEARNRAARDILGLIFWDRR